MAFEPDIVVLGPEASEIAMVVEAKMRTPSMSRRSIDDTERQLMAYMAAVRSPVGLLVTPEILRVYRDQYLPSQDGSVVRVGEFNATGLFRTEPDAKGSAAALAFEREVQSWLENLATESGLRQLTPELRRVYQQYLAPALAQGVVRSGHPRRPVAV